MKIKKTINLYLIYITAFAIILSNTALSMANKANLKTLSFETEEYVEEELNIESHHENHDHDHTHEHIEEEEIEKEEELSEEDLLKLDEQDQFLKRIKSELNYSKSDYRQMLNNISDTKSKIQALTEEKLTLNAQISNLNYQINSTTKDLIDVIKKIILKENQIALIYEQIEIREVALNYLR